MMIVEREYNPVDVGLDYAAFMAWMAPDTGDAGEHRFIISAMKEAIREELTQTQLLYISEYFVNELSMPEIGKKYGVNKSTVSRTITRGMKALKRVLRFCSPSILRFSAQSMPRISRHTTQRRIIQDRHFI